MDLHYLFSSKVLVPKQREVLLGSDLEGGMGQPLYYRTESRVSRQVAAFADVYGRR